jgi:dihydrodipicolinate synthase/N-acetylneuraminate lyase
MTSPPLSGIIPPLLSPLRAASGLDGPALERLVEYVISGGVSGIFIGGSTGEGPALSREVRTELIYEGIRMAGGRVHVLINISSSSYAETIHYCELAAREGADYVVLSPPFYYRMNPFEVLHYYKSLAELSPLPVIIYNAPQYTKIQVDPILVGELLEHSNIEGIKDSSGNIDYIKEVLQIRRKQKFPILIGPELLLGESLLLGCDGGISGGANLYPGLYVDFYKAVLAENKEKMEYIQAALVRIQTGLYEVVRSPMGIIIALKYLLCQRGICSDQMAMPVYEALSTEQKNSLIKLDQEILAL